MRNIFNKVLFGKGALASLLVILSLLFVMGFACKNTSDSESSNSSSKKNSDDKSSGDKSSSDKSSGDIPSDSKLQSLAKQTLMDFNEAIQSGDFSDFHSTLSEPFQQQASADKLAGVFHEFVESKIDFSSAKNLDATFTPAPTESRRWTPTWATRTPLSFAGKPGCG